MLRANALSLTVSARSPLEKFKGSEGMETLAITAIVSDFQHPAVLNVCHPIHLNSKFNRLDHETIGLYPMLKKTEHELSYLASLNPFLACWIFKGRKKKQKILDSKTCHVRRESQKFI